MPDQILAVTGLLYQTEVQSSTDSMKNALNHVVGGSAMRVVLNRLRQRYICSGDVKEYQSLLVN